MNIAKAVGELRTMHRPPSAEVSEETITRDVTIFMPIFRDDYALTVSGTTAAVSLPVPGMPRFSVTVDRKEPLALLRLESREAPALRIGYGIGGVRHCVWECMLHDYCALRRNEDLVAVIGRRPVPLQAILQAQQHVDWTELAEHVAGYATFIGSRADVQIADHDRKAPKDPSAPEVAAPSIADMRYVGEVMRIVELGMQWEESDRFRTDATEICRGRMNDAANAMYMGAMAIEEYAHLRAGTRRTRRAGF